MSGDVAAASRQCALRLLVRKPPDHVPATVRQPGIDRRRDLVEVVQLGFVIQVALGAGSVILRSQPWVRNSRTQS